MENQCLLCNGEILGSMTKDNDTCRYICEVCGNVALHQKFHADDYSKELHLISGWTRERTEKKESPLVILPDDIEATTEGITVSAIVKLPTIPRRIGEKINKLLEALYTMTRYFGEELALKSHRDYTLAYLEHPLADRSHRHPFHKLTEQMIKEGWLSLNTDKKYSLTVLGFQYVESMRICSSESRDCFIAMKFGDAFLDQAFKEAIEPAVGEAGFNPIQMAYLEHNNNIVDELIASIRKSRFVVADLTGQNQNVYFEAGFAQGLGIPVIYTCCDKDVDNIFFDTQQISQIRWQTTADLQIKLKNRILATIA